MNRTALRPFPAAAAVFIAASWLVAQEPAKESDTKAQPSVAESVMASMRAAEAAATSVELAMETSGRMAGGLAFTTRGVVRVLKAEQNAAPKSHTVVDYEFGDGLAGRVETVQSEDGVYTLQQDPTFGESFVHIDAAVCRDLDWAAAASKEGEVPFRANPRAMSPLGADLFSDLMLRFALQPIEKPAPDGTKGTWFAGARKKAPGVEDDGADLPLADRVEAFVREDSVLLDVAYMQKDEVVQRVRVTWAVLGGAIARDSFRIDAGGKKPVAAKDHPPTWQQIEQALQRATEKKNGELPPSRR